jgi:hypothetical protein
MVSPFYFFVVRQAVTNPLAHGCGSFGGSHEPVRAESTPLHA